GGGGGCGLSDMVEGKGTDPADQLASTRPTTATVAPIIAAGTFQIRARAAEQSSVRHPSSGNIEGAAATIALGQRAATTGAETIRYQPAQFVNHRPHSLVRLLVPFRRRKLSLARPGRVRAHCGSCCADTRRPFCRRPS